MLRTGDWTEEKFWCNLLVFLARKLFFELAPYVLIRLILNLINWIWFDYDYNELDCIFEVSSDYICCDLALYKSTELNWTE